MILWENVKLVIICNVKCFVTRGVVILIDVFPPVLVYTFVLCSVLLLA